MDVLVTSCSHCEKVTVVCSVSAISDLTTKKPNDFIGFKCQHCHLNFGTTFGKCRVVPNELKAV
jgi:hypothetical protein